MRRNRIWVSIAVALYAFVMWSAYRWAVEERPPEGNIFDRIEHEGVLRLAAEEHAKEQPPLPPTGESRLNAASPAFVAARYDRTQVVFVVSDAETRFSNTPSIRFFGTPTRIAAPATPAAPLAGLQELYEPDAQAIHFFPKIVQKTQPGDHWTLSVSPDTSIPVVIERPVIAPIGCTLAVGFLASIPPDHQSAVDESSGQYFVVRRTAVESADPPSTSHLGELFDWRPSRAASRQIAQQLNDRMKQEVAKIDARLLANAGPPGIAAGEFPVGSRPHLREWIRTDQALTRGEGKLDYDLRAFHITPDGVPRVFARARWTINDATVFLMSAWFKADSSLKQTANADPQPSELFKTVSLTAGDDSNSEAPPVLLSSDASWSAAMREQDSTSNLGAHLDFETVLNVFDADHDGWAELLVHTYDVHSSPGASTTITLYLYTDLGLVPLKTPLHRDAKTPEACIDP